ncbi:MAG: transketolase family protein, partial [Clostridia bacterium]|nr:transketolase family protein [Clostridia bacterium]
MADKKATREALGDELTALGAVREDLVVLTADLADATRVEYFRHKYPERFIECGIAEANMMGVAAGLAATGKVAVASSFAMFAAGRAFEQIRNSIGYTELNVKIAATHAGVSVGEDGASHQCNEDIALMRTIPGMTVINPADYTEARTALRAAVEMNGPCYIRFGRAAVPDLSAEEENYSFEIGKGRLLSEGKDVTVIASGLTVAMALEAKE